MSSDLVSKAAEEAVESNDIKKVGEIIENELKRLSTNPGSKCDLELQNSLVFKTAECNNKEMTDLILKFIDELDNKFDTLHNLQYYLKHGIIFMDLKFTEFMLENGVRLTDSEWPNVILDRIYLDTRKDMMQLLLKYDTNTRRIRDKRGGNILHFFVRRFVRKNDEDAVEIVEMLINSGVPGNAPNADGFTPLHYAVERENIQLVKFFINRGADIDARDNYGRSLMHLGCKFNDCDLLEFLVSLGADVNSKDMAGGTPLHVACSSNQEKVITFLVRQGAGISTKNLFNITPFFLLRPEEKHYDEATIAMVKEFAKMSFENIPILVDDEKAIQEIPEIKENFDKCMSELEKMKSSKFHGACSYYSLLKATETAVKKLATLLRNEDFLPKFEDDLNTFSFYKSDLKEILDKAMEIRDKILIVESRLIEIFGDHLPKLVIKQLAEYLKEEDLPLE